MNKLQELMTITMEECGELIQACSKSIRCDDYKNNDDLKLSDNPDNVISTLLDEH